MIRSSLLRLSLCAALALSCVTALRAQTYVPPAPPNSAKPFNFYQYEPYRADFIRPAAILGYEPGEFHTTYANFERILRDYAAKSNRLRVYERDRTVEHRTLYTVAISSPENIARLDAIKTNLAKLADPRKLSDADADALVKDTPIVVWLAYNIHGNESAAFEAMIHVFYTLVASDNQKITDLLKNTVVIINPCQNPDGHERFATWYNATGIGRPEPYALEHNEPWSIYGRLNHYLYDLNRDMLVASQIESQSAMKAFQEWHPQVSADHHGQTANYFFPPAALPINPNIGKATAEKWLDVFGRGNAAAFDRYGWNYYSRDVFDLFYPGYWDSWPALNGATGMTYETDGGGWRGLNWRRDDDSILTMRDGIAKHVTASLATVETAVNNREARLRDYRQFFKDAMDEGAKGKVRQFVIPPGSDPTRTANLVGLLLRHGIEVTRAKSTFTLKGVHDYVGGTNASREFPAGSYVVSLVQPNGRLAKSILEPDTKQDKEFIARQIEKMRRNEGRGDNAAGEYSEFYDITSWTLPLTFGVDAFWSEDGTAATGEAVTTAPAVTAAAPARANTAYVFSSDTDGADKLALKLLQDGYKLATAVRPLRAGSKDYPRGAFILRVERNPDSLHERLAQLAPQYGVTVDPVNSAFIDTGITGVGSEAIVTLRPPKIAVIADDAVNQTSYGALWFNLTREMDIDFTPISINTFKGIKMSEYNVLILPDGGSGAYQRAFGKEGIEKLKSWCAEGGTLICFEGAMAFATNKDVDLTSARPVEGENDVVPDAKDAKPAPAEAKPEEKPEGKGKEKGKGKEAEKPAPAPDAKPEGFKLSARRPIPIPGAIFRAKADLEHFMTFGYERPEMMVPVFGSNFYKPSKTGTNVLTIHNGTAISGFTWEGNTEPLIRNTVWLIEEPVGGGHVILFATDPMYRSIWQAHRRLVYNSLIFAPTINFSTGIK